MKSLTVTVQQEHGLHCREAARVVKAAQSHESRITIHCKGCPEADACSILELLMLGAVQGTCLEIEAGGIDEDAAIQSMADIFEQGGGI
ncbi:MAG: HPr family phosphocarrier protein [Deltaproteobacteria bacterium]|nr:HPr family phosphocarrier protein [Deltaproteobacteria bacterium]